MAIQADAAGARTLTELPQVTSAELLVTHVALPTANEQRGFFFRSYKSFAFFDF